jgi:hypothetical protein
VALSILRELYNGCRTSLIFIPSAIKHGIKEEDIRHAFKSHICDVFMAGQDNKYAVIGFDLAGNPLELMYNRIGEGTVKIFHAMKDETKFRTVDSSVKN